MIIATIAYFYVDFLETHRILDYSSDALIFILNAYLTEYYMNNVFLFLRLEIEIFLLLNTFIQQ